MHLSFDVNLIKVLELALYTCSCSANVCIGLLNIFTDHKHNNNLTHAQATSTRPGCSLNRYKTRPGIEAK